MSINKNCMRHSIFRSVLVVAISFGAVQAQDKSIPGAKAGPPLDSKLKRSIPTLRVRPSPSEVSALEGTPSRRFATGDARPLVSPPALGPDARRRLLRDSGIEVGSVSAPREFRLSPQKPYVSSSAYLFFNGGIEFNAADDSLVLRTLTPGLPVPDWTGGRRSTETAPHSILGVLIRMEAGGRYVADFSLSSEFGATYSLTVNGAEGDATFTREAGAHHILVLLDSAESGYVRLNLWGSRPPSLAARPSTFTFHNVVVTKLD